MDTDAAGEYTCQLVVQRALGNMTVGKKCVVCPFQNKQQRAKLSSLHLPQSYSYQRYSDLTRMPQFAADTDSL